MRGVRTHRFNPCSAGFVSERSSRCLRTASASICFNPCSAGFVSERLDGDHLAICRLEVSILVLLDSSLSANAKIVCISLVSSFNPCSAGFVSERMLTTLDSLSPLVVSILVLLDSSLSERWLARRTIIANFVSILVLLDSSLSAFGVAKLIG